MSGLASVYGHLLSGLENHRVSAGAVGRDSVGPDGDAQDSYDRSATERQAVTGSEVTCRHEHWGTPNS